MQIEDYSKIESEKFTKDNKEYVKIPSFKEKNPKINLGIYKSQKWGIRSDKYCGYSWLKGQNNDILKDCNNNGIVLHIEPRFGLKLNDMLQTIASDEEFFDYLGLETDDPMIQFFHDDPMIENVDVNDNMNMLISAISFISLLNRTTRVSVIKRMVTVEENAVGRLRGHILMNKHISRNVCQGHKERIYAAHNERTENIRENRMLLYVLERAEEYLGKNVLPSIKMMISVIRNRLSRVEMNHNETFSYDDIDHMIIKLPNIFRNYVAVFEYAKLILAENDVSAGNNTGAKVVPYAINSYMLFECYVRACIKEIIKDINEEKNKKDNKTKEYRIEMLKYVRDKENIPDDNEYGVKNIIKNGSDDCYIVGKVVPDIVIKYTYIGEDRSKDFYRVYDVKYKDPSTKYRGRDDRLQLLAYNLIYHPVDNNTGLIMPKTQARIKINTEKDFFGVIVSPEEKDWLREMIEP